MSSELSRGTGNALIPLKEALRLRATVGEVCDALREVWGIPAESMTVVLRLGTSYDLEHFGVKD